MLAQPAAAQSAALSRAMDLEANGKLRDAAASYRESLAAGEMAAALLGLERVYAQLGWNDSLVPVLDAALRQSPRDPIARTVQLRVLRALHRDAAATAAFRAWVRAAPGDIAPYREWSRLLLADGEAARVDTVLQDAIVTLGSSRGLSLEVAQLRAALGQWDHASLAWRDAMAHDAYVESAAEFSLRAAPPDARRLVRAVLMSPPVQRGPRRVLAALELGWGNGREAWVALRDLPPGDSTAAMWTTFAENAERSGAWLPARDALLAVQRWKPDAQRALRAAINAVEGGDAENGLLLAAQAAERLGPEIGPRAALPVVLEAYGLLGRGADAARAYAAIENQLATGERATYRRLVAWAWVRSGAVSEARAALHGATPDPDDELTGWLALYDGDLAGARRGLRRADARVPDAATAVAFLSRTRAERNESAGSAFLALARTDTVAAARAFLRAAQELRDAASVLLLSASRLHSLQRKDDAAIAIWDTLVRAHADTPEAAEAELEWARLLRRRGDNAGALGHLEHLILTWPESALLPQARREIEVLRGREDEMTGGRDE